VNLRFKCDCGCLIVVPAGQAGKRGPCPRCGKLVRAPLQSAEEAGAPQPEPVPVLSAAPQAESEAPPPSSLPLLPLATGADAPQRKRTTAILHVEAQDGPRETPLPRPSFNVEHRSCPECAEKINARATQCFYCGAHFEPMQVGLTRRILPGQLNAGRSGQATLALRFSLLGLIVPVYALSLIGLGMGAQAYFHTPKARVEISRRAKKAIWFGLLGCAISTLVIAIIRALR